MIKINLLPQKSKPLIVLWRDGSILCGIIFILIIGIFIFTVKMNSRIKELTRHMKEIKKQIESSEIDLEKLEKLKKDKAVLENKLNIISSLREKQSWPVHMLEDLCCAMPDHIWLENLINQGDALRMEGMTPSYNAVSDFMRNLARSPYFKEIELENIQQSPTRGKTFHRFWVTCQIDPLPACDKESGEKNT